MTIYKGYDKIIINSIHFYMCVPGNIKKEDNIMTVSKTAEGSVVTVSVSGRIDSKTAPEFEEQLRSSFDSADKMTVDLADVNYISSAGLRVLLSAHKAMAGKSGLVIKNARKEVMAVFDVTGFSGVLNIE